MASTPASTKYVGILSTPDDFPIYGALTAASTASRKLGKGSSSGICGLLSTVGSPSV